jgi:hypothetical protein
MSIRQEDILKHILLQEFERMQPDISTFEDDPMQFILRKYPGLNETLTYLMTDSFKDYLTGVYIVAPKPTTFKIVLHNGQFFFLQFTGKTYQATVAGKNYYLMSIGEKERCMLAIARLLRFGSPLKTKGPEGAEQGTRDAEGGESAGGETGGGEEAAPEAGGEEEPIAEAKILEEVLKKTLVEQSDTVWSTTLRVKDLNKPTPSNWLKKNIKTRGNLLLYFIIIGKKILVAKDPNNTENTSEVKLNFIGDFKNKFEKADYSSIDDTKQIFKDVESGDAFSISNIVR